MIEDKEISDTNRIGEDEPSLESQLTAERTAREAADREILALRTEKQALEYRVINANRTLAYGLGRALIEARSLRGLMALPGKLRRLRSKQRVKRRERVPNSFDDDISKRLKLVEPALEKAAADGARSASDWVVAEREGPAATARALCEIAHWVLPDDLDMAGDIAIQAATVDPTEARLFSLAQRLREAGCVKVPASLCDTIRSKQPLSALDQKLCDRIIEDGEILVTGRWSPPRRSAEAGDRESAGLLLLCPVRWHSLSTVRECQSEAEAAGFVATVAASLDEVDLTTIDVIHIFASSIGQGCDDAVRGSAAGCRLVVDIANPPEWQGIAPESEMAVVEKARLFGLQAIADQIIVRSEGAASLLEQFGIEHVPISAHFDHDPDAVEESIIAAARVEYGIEVDGPAIGIAATLNGDSELLQCLTACAALKNPTFHLLVFGKGDAGVIARHAETLNPAPQLHFLGLPPPQRWRALLAGIDLILFPSESIEPLGSEIPALLNQACVDQLRILGSEAAWMSQGSWQVDPNMIISADGNWAERIDAALNSPPISALAADSGQSISGIYQWFSKPTR